MGISLSGSDPDESQLMGHAKYKYMENKEKFDLTQKEKLILAFKKALKSLKCSGSIYVDDSSGCIRGCIRGGISGTSASGAVLINNGYISIFKFSSHLYTITYGIIKEDINEDEFNELFSLIKEKDELLKKEKERFERDKCEKELNHFLKY